MPFCSRVCQPFSPPPRRAQTGARRTPKRCCSSTMAKARAKRRKRSSSRAWVPTIRSNSPTRCRHPGPVVVTPLGSAECSNPVRTFALFPQSLKVWKCCSANTAVGAMNRTWPPARAMRTQAAKATAVLAAAHIPLQQALHRERSVEVVENRGDGTVLWVLVSVNGSAAFTSDRNSRTVGRTTPRLFPSSCDPLARQSHLRDQQILEGEPDAGLVNIRVASSANSRSPTDSGGRCRKCNACVDAKRNRGSRTAARGAVLATHRSNLRSVPCRETPTAPTIFFDGAVNRTGEHPLDDWFYTILIRMRQRSDWRGARPGTREALSAQLFLAPQRALGPHPLGWVCLQRGHVAGMDRSSASPSGVRAQLAANANHLRPPA